jgi:hypothetical protein
VFSCIIALVIGWPSTIRRWGSTPAERSRAYGCDVVLPDADDALFRAVEIHASAPVVFRWLCQLRRAPYSYDRLDNRGRRSPQELTPGLDALEVGQRVMSIFRLVSFEPGRSITLLHDGRHFGRVAVTYAVEPIDVQRSRLVAKLAVQHAGRVGLRAALMRLLLPPGDLVMMRRQLLNLKGLAERNMGNP